MVWVVAFVAMVVRGFEGAPVISPPTTITISHMWRIVVSGVGELLLVSATPPIRVGVMGRGFMMGHMTHQGSGRGLVRCLWPAVS